jgi:hypothetical protein
MVKCLDVDTCEKFERFEPWDCKKIKILGNKLITRLEKLGERIRPMFKQKLQQAIKELGEETDSIRSQVAATTLKRRDDYWELFVAENVFHTSLWGLERLCYGGLYYSYECYLTQCLRLKRRKPDYRWKRFDQCFLDFQAAFGSTLAESCLKDGEINIARLTRNALAHNGGRITKEFEGLTHTFCIEGGEIQINAEHTTSLFHKLKDQVIALTASAIVMPEFQL